MKTPTSPLLLILVTVTMLFAACASAAASPAPSSTPAGGPVTTPEQAVAAVIAHEPRLTGITQRDPDAIGQANWYEVAPASGVGAFIVKIRIGWGDCPAGCINEHTWVYAVGPNGEVTLQSEGGEAVPDAMWPNPGPAASGGANGGPNGPGTGIFVTAGAGPTCPVETVPADPNCAARPVAGAVIVITDAQGGNGTKVQLDDSGTAFIELTPGDYVVQPLPVEGLMGTPESQTVTVIDGKRTAVEFAYDTGIRAPG
jgi:hypothetical protein